MAKLLGLGRAGPLIPVKNVCGEIWWFYRDGVPGGKKAQAGLAVGQWASRIFFSIPGETPGGEGESVRGGKKVAK